MRKTFSVGNRLLPYIVYTNFRLSLYGFSSVCKMVPIFLESVEREDRGGRGGEEEENMAMQSYQVLKP